ncbi:MAG: sulfite exporter TauE/SafE family protein [Gammaproteobacteria bacterium]|nr:MAG: sulfite exporter TauE/SafE family protein [Gammaproteobacteria bacterium]
MLFEFTLIQLMLIALIFVWSGFVRSGLGFGGAALGLPLMLLVYDQPVFWLPIIGAHLLFFSTLTLRTRFRDVGWPYLLRSAVLIVPAAIAGVFGLINLPNQIMVIFIYAITLFYAFMWLFGWRIHSSNRWVDRLLLMMGGYIAGTSLTGAPLIVAVYMRNVAAKQLRNTLLVLWFILVSIKMSTFAALSVPLQLDSALMLLPIAAIGHVIGLKAHDKILENDIVFKRMIGSVLAVICLLGLSKALF